jgi:hypothetical protein
MMLSRIVTIAALLVAVFPALAGGKPEPDVLILNSGERLIGQLVSSNATSVAFKSVALGSLTVDWSKVKEFHSSRRFAVVPKDVNPARPEGIAEIVHGTLSMSDQKMVVAGATTITVPVAESEHVVDEAAFQNAIESQPGIFGGWKGSLTGGISLVEATQDSRTFTGSANFVRAIPSEDWLAPRDRTSINLSAAYGDATQPGAPKLLTSIYHGDGERDEYLSDRWFAFGQISYDHNFGQGLDFGQDYGGGVGWTVLKTATEDLDLKGSFGYIRRDLTGAPTDNLAGLTTQETYNRKFKHGVVFSEQISLIGALNQEDAYSASANAKLIMPLHKKFNFTVASVDNYLGDPPAGFRRNSFQFTTGLTYSLK